MLLIYNARLVDKNTDKKGAVLIKDTKITKILSDAEAKEMMLSAKTKAKNKIEKLEATGSYSIIKMGDTEFMDAYGLTIMPSFIDMHAHFRDPGFTQKEDIESGCRAAVAGGYGTVVLMPNTNPVISSQEQAEVNNNKAKALGLVDVIQSVSITNDFSGNDVSHLGGLDSKIVPLITEDGKEVASSAVMYAGMKIAAKKKIIVSCHCEDPSFAQQARVYRNKALACLQQAAKLSQQMAQQTPAPQQNSAVSSAAIFDLRKQASSYFTEANHLLALAEDVATVRNIYLAKDANCHIHLCHVSTANCIDAIRSAKQSTKQSAKQSAKQADAPQDKTMSLASQMVTCEITPHHLSLVGTKAPYLYDIVNPPLRSEEDRAALIRALADGTADCISTDHAPHTAQDKAAGSPGFSGIETAFAVCNTTLVKENNFSLKKLSALMSANAAEILGLKKRGLLQQGYDADIVIVDPQKEWTVHGASFASKGKFTPLEGKKITGKVIKTFYKGKQVYS